MINASTTTGALRSSGEIAVQLNGNFIKAGDEEPKIYALQTHFMTDSCIISQSITARQNHCSNQIPFVWRGFLSRKIRDVSLFYCVQPDPVTPTNRPLEAGYSSPSSAEVDNVLTLILLTWRIWCARTSASKWRMGFNSVFKGLNYTSTPYVLSWRGPN